MVSHLEFSHTLWGMLCISKLQTCVVGRFLGGIFFVDFEQTSFEKLHLELFFSTVKLF